MYIGTPCKFNDTPEITQCCIEDFFLGGGEGGQYAILIVQPLGGSDEEYIKLLSAWLD